MATQKISPWPFVGIGGLACLFFLYAASILFWPWWVVAVLLLVWLVLQLIGFRWFTPRPVATAWLPLVGVAVYLLVLLADVLT